MVVEKNQIFNMMDTNGRRSDVLNALKIYLEILEELKNEYPTESWNTYPNSNAQFLFYEKALEKSKDVFKIHKKYDMFMEELGDHYQLLLNKNSEWLRTNLPQIADVLDEAIEKRARHYTSNLVKMGFTNSGRTITEAGYSYLRGSIVRDSIEEFLPLDDVNIALFRQLSKLKIFGTPDKNGKRQFYSPFLMALVLLLDNKSIGRESFEIIIQGLSPYSEQSLKSAICQNTVNITGLETAIQNIPVTIPAALSGKADISFDLFKSYFTTSKNTVSTSQKYYNFYVSLRNFRAQQSEENYTALLNCFDKDSALLYKAFGYGKAVFDMGNKTNRHDLKTFLEKNKNHPLLVTCDYVHDIYITFAKSKWIDGIREYSDTTVRLLSATGLFKFKNLPELSYQDILSIIFDIPTLRNNIFGEMTEEQFCAYECQKDFFYGKNSSFCEIFGYTDDKIHTIITDIERYLGVTNSKAIKSSLQDKKNTEFLRHIKDKYPKDKIIKLLPLFSDRKKDSQIKKEVNDAATVPTIYEYIIGIAWYYISNEDFDLYDSLNLTLNADFEPVIHAGGGDGDIVITYNDMVVMLEVTLMNKQAQKRGEWEPVLRHSLNLKAANEPKETITFFIADELDNNTVNIWRAVAAAALESTNTHQPVEGVVIMPFTNRAILNFLETGTPRTRIIEEVKKSFAKVPQITDNKWHDDILSALARP